MDNIHPNLPMINSIFWGLVKVERCDITAGELFHLVKKSQNSKHANVILQRFMIRPRSAQWVTINSWLYLSRLSRSEQVRVSVRVC